MTPHETELAKALAGCGWVGKRFADNMERLTRLVPTYELTLRQRHYMEILAWRYRRQIAPHLVPEREPLPMPKRPPKPKKVRSTKKVELADTQRSLF